MSDRKIEIKIAATGGDQAAGEVRKVEAAAKQAAAASSTGFGGMLDSSPERIAGAEAVIDKIEETTEVIEDQASAMEQLGEVSDDAAKKTSELDENVSKIARVQKAQVVAQIAEAFGKVASSVRATANEIAEVDPALASSMRNMADGIEQVSEKAQAMAQGFAAGGAVGAGMMLVATLAKDAAVEFVKMSADLDSAAAAEGRALEMQTKLNLALAGVRDPAAEAATASAELAARYGEETAALKEVNAELNRRNKLLDAQAAEKAAARDLQDQRAIAGGASPEDVQAKRALDDAAAKKALIDKKLRDEADLLNKRFRANQEGRGQLETDQISDAQTPEQLTEREKALKAEEAKLAQDLAEFRNRQMIAESNKRGIDSAATGTVERLGADKSTRLQREQEQAAAKAKRQQEQADRERLQQLEDQRDGTARGIAGKIGGSKNRNSELQAIGNRLADGTSDAEIAKLGQQMIAGQQAMGAATTGALQGFLNQLTAQTKEIEILRKQIKNR